MTIPPTTILPLHTQDIATGKPEDLENYFRELVFKLTTDYEAIADSVNGLVQYSTADEPTLQWEPELFGTTSPGTATYTTQIGWAVRVGQLVDVFFEIEWSGHTGTGNLYLELPYDVVGDLAGTDTAPFVGSVIPDGITFAGGRTAAAIQAVSDTTRGEFMIYGSGLTSENLAVPAAGRIQGTLRYIGESADEQ